MKPRSKPAKKKAWRDPLDWYCEDEAPVRALLAHWCACDPDQRGIILDPACGRGNIVSVARSQGWNAYGSDIVDRGFEEFFVGAHNFLTDWPLYVPQPAHIVCNPPYSYKKGICEAFARRALTLATHSVCLLVPTGWLSSIERKAFFAEDCPPTQLCFLSKRPSMPPGVKITELGDKAFKGGRINYCWVCWDLIDPAPRPPVWLLPPGPVA